MPPPQFPQIDPATLAQAIKTFVTQRQNVPALSNGGSVDYNAVVDGWAEALTTVSNPTVEYFDNNQASLYSLVGQQQQSSVPTLLFNTVSPLSIGQWVYQVSSDTVDAANFNNIANGPSIGIVVATPTASTVSVQNVGSFLYNANMGFPYLPLTPDTTYYISSGGEITASPNPGAGGFVQEIGYAKTSFEFVLNVQEPILV